MKQLKVVSILATTFALALTSCGGEADLDGATGQVAPAAAALLVANPAFTAMIATIAPQTNGNITAPGLGGVVGIAGADARGFADPPYDTCSTEEGSRTDGPDADGIPVNFVQRFNCENVSDAAATRWLLSHS